MTLVYVSPAGAGSKSGASAQNAFSFSSLDAAIKAAGAGGTVILLADVGTYNLSSHVSIYSGGLAGAPVTIRGANSSGQPMDIEIHGTRSEVYTPGMPSGNEVFRLLAGANHLVFEGINFHNVGTAYRIGADIVDLTIQDSNADNVKRFVENYVSGTNTSATVSGLTIRDVEVHGFSKGVIRLQYNTNNVLIENVFGDSQFQDGDGIAMGIHLAGTVHDVVIRNTTMMNAIASGTDTEYWNGDGFSTERGVFNVRFENTLAVGNADGGYDLKSSSTVLVNAVADGNGRNFRLWGEIELIDAVGIDPHKLGGTGGQLQIHILSGANVTVTGGQFVDSGSHTKVVDNDGGLVRFSETSFTLASTALLSEGSGISGLNPDLVRYVTATGLFSVDSESLLQVADAPTTDVAPWSADLALAGGAVQEGAAAGTVAANLSFTSSSGSSGPTFSLLDNAGGRFAIDPQTGAVTIADAASIDYEATSQHQIVVQASTSAGSHSESFVISVTNRNEAPKILSITGGNVLENSAAGTLVASVTGSDPDMNDQLRYSLVQDGGGRFEIDPSTGAVKVAAGAVLDYEAASRHDLVVRVSDSAGLVAEQALSVIVGDVAEAELATVVLKGTSRNDVLTATSNNPTVLEGYAGDDVLTGAGGNDLLFGGSGNDKLFGGAGNDVFRVGSKDGFDAMDGGSGIDRIDATGDKVVIGLSSLTGVEKISANGFSGVTISGSSAGDFLDFSKVDLSGINQILGGGGSDRIYGSASADRINGGAGADWLQGGGGSDVFLYTSAADSAAGANDVILDFMSGVDVLDLSAIDANSGVRGNQDFNFIGNAGFSGKAGELRVDSSDPSFTMLMADLDGNRVADFAIKLLGNPVISPTDMSGVDVINLSVMDASSGVRGNQAFNSSATTDFSGKAEEPSFTMLKADLDGNAGADFSWKLLGMIAPTDTFY